MVLRPAAGGVSACALRGVSAGTLSSASLLHPAKNAIGTRTCDQPPPMLTQPPGIGPPPGPGIHGPPPGPGILPPGPGRSGPPPGPGKKTGIKPPGVGPGTIFGPGLSSSFHEF